MNYIPCKIGSMGKYDKVGPIKKTAPKEVEVVKGASNDGPEAESSLTEQNAIEGAEQAEAAEEPKENGVESIADNAVMEDVSDSKIQGNWKSMTLWKIQWR